MSGYFGLDQVSTGYMRLGNVSSCSFI